MVFVGVTIQLVLAVTDFHSLDAPNHAAATAGARARSQLKRTLVNAHRISWESSARSTVIRLSTAVAMANVLQITKG